MDAQELLGPSNRHGKRRAFIRWCDVDDQGRRATAGRQHGWGCTRRRQRSAQRWSWSETIQRLLAHLREQGVTWVPEPLGSDEDGRDRLSYLPGVVPQYPLPDWIWSDVLLVDAARALAELHRASAGVDAAGACWRMPSREPAEVICHNDFAPYNMVFADERLTGVIDWDTASPGPRVWDLSYLAYRLVPLTDPSGAGDLPSDLARRMQLLCDTYGHGMRPADVLTTVVERLHDLAAYTQARVEEGHVNLGSHVDLYRRDAHWVTTRLLDE